MEKKLNKKELKASVLKWCVKDKHGYFILDNGKKIISPICSEWNALYTDVEETLKEIEEMEE